MKHFLRLLIVAIFTFACVGKTSAQQDVELVNSANVIFEGSIYYAIGKYNKAAGLFKKVSRNDTNYVVSLLNLCYAYHEDKEDSLCWLSAKKGIELESEMRPDFYNLAGMSLKEMKKYDQSIATLDEGIAKYPYSYSLLYNKGLAYYEQKKFKEAETCFQLAIKINQFHAMSHFYLGKCEADQGRAIPALLSFEYYLILSTDNERQSKTVVTVEDMYKNNYDWDPETRLDPDETGDECFDDLLQIIKDGSALKPGYKNNTGINYDFVKVRQMMFETMSYKSGTKNWWMDTYIPFFIELQAKGHFVAFNYWTLSSISDPKIQKGFKKNKKKIKAFGTWVVEYNNDHSTHPALELLTEKENEDIIFYDNQMVMGIGHTNAVTKKPYGEWTYFYGRSGILLGKGMYSTAGKVDGTWTYYFENGNVKERTNYKNGLKDGSSEFWWSNGEKRSVYQYKMDKLEGDYEGYKFSGAKDITGSFKNGLLNGPCTLYYSNDKERFVMNYLNGKLNGPVKSYYRNGQLSSEFTSTLDKKNGVSKEYYYDGKLFAEGSYKNDLEVGEWKVYHRNGKVLREGIYKTAGKREGVWKEYFESGKIATEATYKAGKANGTVKEYDENGTVVNEKVYKSDILTKDTWYNSKGNVLGQFIISKGETNVTEYYPNGAEAGRGDYYKNEKSGEWTYYDENGWKFSTVNFRSGYLDGSYKVFHPNGKVAFETEYFLGFEHGYRKSWHINGEIESEGWVQFNSKQGDWFEYNMRGIETSHTYYLNDNEYGTQEFSNARGVRREEVKIKNGVGVLRTMYDSTGKVEYEMKAPNGTADFSPMYTGGKQAWHAGKFSRGYRDGAYTKYGWDGRVVWEGTYQMGNLEGSRKVYYNWTDQVYSDVTMHEGDVEGTTIGYWENGQKRFEENYVDGELDGEQKYYHDNGQLQRTITYVDGEIDGESKVYAEDGKLVWVRYYAAGRLKGYSYEGTDGTILPMKELEDGTGTVEAYFSNGKGSIKGEFANGEINGHWVEYFSDGTVSEDENFNYGERDGVQKFNYRDGKTKSVITYYFGQIDGECKYYYPNGQLKRQEFWTLDQEWSRWYFYNEDGALTTTRLFYGGIQQDEVVVPVAPKVEPKKPKAKTK